jgi:glycosyltransferase involved in cell wall biosynthesis
MRFHIISRDIQRHDAVGNFCRQMGKLLHAEGHDVCLAADNVHPDDRNIIRPIPIALLDVAEQDIIIFHFSTDDPTFPAIARLPNHKILYFHNITPAHFAAGSNTRAGGLTQRALDQRALAARFDVLMANSQASADVLYEGLSADGRRQIARSDIIVCPPFVNVDRWAEIAPEPIALPTPDRFVLFVGHLVPHKGVRDLLEGFAVLAAHDATIGLVVVGNPFDIQYTQLLKDRVESLDAPIASRIVFLHDIPDAILRFLYERASLYASMSEHEGFNIPLVDAMAFDKPIVIRAEPAMMETAGDAALVVSTSSPEQIAGAIAAVLDDPTVASRLAEHRKSRLAAIRKAADGRRIIEAAMTAASVGRDPDIQRHGLGCWTSP